VFLNRCQGQSAIGTEAVLAVAVSAREAAVSEREEDSADKKCHLSRKKLFIELGHLRILLLFIICNLKPQKLSINVLTCPQNAIVL
jgi:hypothetical protein